MPSDPGTGDLRRELRETYRQQLLIGIGGWSGAVITAIPTVVFVIVNVFTSLTPALLAAVGTALVLAVYRFARNQPIMQAASGLFGVLLAAAIASWTGQARGFFLVHIWTSFAYAVPFAISVLVRRPIVGLLWEFLDPTPHTAGAPTAGDPEPAAPVETVAVTPTPAQPDEPAPRWYRVRPLLIAYTWATLAATTVFLARGIVQLTLYGENATGWLAFARIAMGYPLFLAAVGFSFLVVTRARRRIGAA